MTTEDDFQAALDAHPEDWQTRLVFADWLEERGDVRAGGYRAMGASRVHPFTPQTTHYWISTGHWWYWANGAEVHQLQEDWWTRWRDSINHHNGGVPTRRAAEDAAALVFAQLPAARRAELLNPRGAVA